MIKKVEVNNRKKINYLAKDKVLERSSSSVDDHTESNNNSSNPNVINSGSTCNNVDNVDNVANTGTGIVVDINTIVSGSSVDVNNQCDHRDYPDFVSTNTISDISDSNNRLSPMGCINTAIDFAFDSADYVYKGNKNETILRSGIKTDPVIGTNILNENNVDNNSTVSYSEQPNSEYINDKLYGINTDNLNIDTDFDTKPKACRACVDVMNENKVGNTSNPEQFIQSIQSNQPDDSMSLDSLVGNNNNPEADIDSDSKFHTGATVGVMNENNAGNISNPEQFIQSIQSNQPDSDSEFHTGVTVGKIGNVGHVGNTNNSNNRNSNDNINSNNSNSDNCLLPVCSMDIATDFNGYVYENNNNINMDSDSGTGIIIENNVVNIASEQRNSELVNDNTDNDTDIKPSSTGMSFENENNPGSTACSFSTNLDINCKAGIGALLISLIRFILLMGSVVPIVGILLILQLILLILLVIKLISK